MKKFGFLQILLMFFIISIITVIACKKPQPFEIEQKEQSLTKEQLFKIYTTFSDEDVQLLSVDLDQLIKSNFTYKEQENMILERVRNLQSSALEEVIENLFDEYRQKYKTSYLEENFRQRDEFAEFYLEKLKEQHLIVEDRSMCNWPWLNCTNLSTCPQEGNFVFYSQNKVAPYSIIDYACTRQQGTTDCDNSYDWQPTNHMYNNPASYNFIWYCANSVYRAFMPASISGFKRATAARYSTFLGAQHELAITLTWGLEECPQDAWVQVTDFGALAKFVIPRK